MADPDLKLKASKKTKLMNLEIDGAKQKVTVRQLWKYNWTAVSGVPAWTSKQKTTFHKKIEKAIRKSWSGKFILQVTGKSKFAKAMSGKTLTVIFDVDPVSSGAHYTVNAKKIKPGDWSGSSVEPSSQVINIDTEDMNPEQKPDAPKGMKQTVAAHEFGHAIKAANWTDEYWASHKFTKDVKSIMHSGTKLRKRHADHVVSELSKMIPDTTFKVKSIK
ncbi:MAG: hypothetical protein WA782_11650 [Sulfitobacter sp.]